MSTITLRSRSVAWFVTGAVLAVGVTLMFANAWRVDAAPGDTDSTFVPITPCRLLDSRDTGSLIGGRTVTIQGTGTNGKCVIPSEAVALSMNVTALNVQFANTFLTFWPDGTRPLAASLNPALGEPPTPNAVTTTLSSSGSFNVYNDDGFTDMVIDVSGFYTKSSLQEIEARLSDLENGTSPAIENRLLALEGGNAEVPSGNVLFGQVEYEGNTDDITNHAQLIQVPLNAVIPTELTATTVNFAPGATSGDADTTCTGSVSSPSAPAGQICVYLDSAVGVSAFTAQQIEIPAFGPDQRSFAIRLLPNSFGAFEFAAVWAYTAP